MSPGVHISLEGIDGSGKTTQAYLLLNWLRSQGYRAKYTTEPTYGRIGSVIRLHVYRIRKTPVEYEALLFAADRVEHYLKLIKPLLNRGWVVISDRYLHSSLAYQGAVLKDVRWIREINKFSPPPDLAILIDVPVEKALIRIKRRKVRFEKREVLSKVRREYLRLVERGEVKPVDGMRSIEEISVDIRKIVEKFLRKKGLRPKYPPQSAPLGPP
ncbi:MAG: dTMP kinase [Thermoproteota archaeon]